MFIKTANPPGRARESLGQPGASGSALRISVWDTKANEVIEGAIVTATRLDGLPGAAKDTTGKVGTAILSFPDAPVGTPLFVEVEARGYQPQSLQAFTVSREEAETLDPSLGVMVDLETSPGVADLVMLAVIGGAVWWVIA